MRLFLYFIYLFIYFFLCWKIPQGRFFQIPRSPARNFIFFHFRLRKITYILVVFMLSRPPRPLPGPLRRGEKIWNLEVIGSFWSMFFDDFQAFIYKKNLGFTRGTGTYQWEILSWSACLTLFLLSVIVLTAPIGGDRWALLLAPGLKWKVSVRLNRKTKLILYTENLVFFYPGNLVFYPENLNISLGN